MTMQAANAEKERWIVGITGASGAIYGVKLCEFLLAHGYHLHLIITDAGWRVLEQELGHEMMLVRLPLRLGLRHRYAAMVAVYRK